MQRGGEMGEGEGNGKGEKSVGAIYAWDRWRDRLSDLVDGGGPNPSPRQRASRFASATLALPTSYHPPTAVFYRGVLSNGE